MKAAHTIEAFAAEHNLDASAVKNMVSFLVEKISNNAELIAIAQGDDENMKAAMIESGVKSYIEQRRQLLTEMLDGSTLRARRIRATIADDFCSRVS